MRTKPVTKDEVRLDGDLRFLAVPVNALHKAKSRWCGRPYGECEPIPELWKPLLRQLRREQVKGEPARKEQQERWIAMGLPSFRPYAPLRPPTLFTVWAESASSCDRCRKRFYRRFGNSGRYCSDPCAKAAAKEATKHKIASQVARRSKARAAARADRKCETCGEPIEAARSTRRFCSVRCRVAGYRKSAHAEMIVTRVEANERGLHRYFTGKPCRHGHRAERLTGTGACVECMRARGFCSATLGEDLGLAGQKDRRSLTAARQEARTRLKAPF